MRLRGKSAGKNVRINIIPMSADPGKKILIVDGAAGGAELAAFLERKNYKVRTVSQDRQALDSIRDWKPDLVILDILSSSFNPLEFLAEVKHNPVTENQRIIVFSKTPKADIVTGPAPEVKGYLTKPVDFEALKSLLGSVAPRPNKSRAVTVLVVDDDEEFSDLLQMFLEANNYRPVIVNDPMLAVQAAKTGKPDAIILDLMMSKKDGFRIMSELQDEAVTAAIPIIVVSALRLNNFQERGVLTGLPEIISKELPEDLLLSLIEKESGASGNPAAPASPGDLPGRGNPGAALPPDRPRVLLAEDQTELLLLMKETVEAAGFKVSIAHDGQEALKVIFETHPDIVVLDYTMPVKDGLTVAQDLKNNPLFAHIPIIICTAHSEKATKMKGLSMGIDDYLIKPVDTDELVARIRMILKRNKQVLDTNPLSKLPGNPSIQARVEREIQRGLEFAVLYLDLNNFKAYNDIYGFDAGDRILKATANLLVKFTIQNENSRDFIGHIGGDDFIIVTDFERSEKLAETIVSSFDEISPSFYTKEDRERGYIISTDRQNTVKKFPFLGIAIGIVHNKLRPLVSFAQVSNIGTELKKAAKARDKSAYIMDRRKD